VTPKEARTMPCCTWFDRYQIEDMRKTVRDAEVNELLSEVNAIDAGRWAIHEQQHETRRRFPFRKPKTVTLFTLFAEVSAPEYQIINFAPAEAGGWSINHTVERHLVIAYMLGFLGGRRGASSVTCTRGRA
jgi:hypothetical protein